MPDPQTVAAWAAAFAVGSAAAFAIWSGKRWLRAAVLSVFLLPMLPLAWLLAWLPFGVPKLMHDVEMVGLIAVFSITFSLDRLDPVIMRSLAACGAGPWRRFRMVVLPVFFEPLIFVALGLFLASGDRFEGMGLQFAAAFLLARNLIGAMLRRPA